MSDSATSWPVAPQAPLSLRFSRQEYWSGLSFPSPGDLLSFLHWQVDSLPLSHKGSLVYYCLVQTKESLKECWRRDETEYRNPWIRSCSRRVLRMSYVSHESLEGCTCWNLPRLGHQLVTPSTVCNHACWCSVINLYFSLICLCRFFPVGERVCCRAVSPMHSPKVF